MNAYELSREADRHLGLDVRRFIVVKRARELMKMGFIRVSAESQRRETAKDFYRIVPGPRYIPKEMSV